MDLALLSIRSEADPICEETHVVLLSLCMLERDLLCVIVGFLSYPEDIASLDCTAHVFHSPLGQRRSVVEDSLRSRVAKLGRSVQALLPSNELSWTQFLLWEERRRLLMRASATFSSSQYHTALVGVDRKLYTYSSGFLPLSQLSKGQLGQGTGITYLSRPSLVQGVSGLDCICLATGEAHTLVCTTVGQVFSFGAAFNPTDPPHPIGHFSPLGHGDARHCYAPSVITGLLGIVVVSVAAGAQHSLALSFPGQVYSFGNGAFGQLGHGEPAFGQVGQQEPNSAFGLLGAGEPIRCLRPRLVDALNDVEIYGIAAAGHVSFAWCSSGDAYSWGLAAHGSLGHGLYRGLNEWSPLKISALHHCRVWKISVSERHSMVVCQSGYLYTFGQGIHGQLGHGSYISHPLPLLVKGLADHRVLSVSAGPQHSLVLCDYDAVFAFGNSSHGRLGYDALLYSDNSPSEVISLRGLRVRCVVAGSVCSYAITPDGNLFSWGLSSENQVQYVPCHSHLTRVLS